MLKQEKYRKHKESETNNAEKVMKNNKKEADDLKEKQKQRKRS